ncbi:MAG: heavy metal translocating P-type ATPase [Caldilineaceae bacterium]
MLLESLIVGSGLYAGLRLYRQAKTQKSLITALTNPERGPGSIIAQNAVALPQNSRHQPLALRIGQPTKRLISPAEQAANRDLVTALTASGLLLVGTFLSPPIWLAGAVIMLYLLANLLIYSVRTVFKERRVTFDLVELALGIGVMIGGYFTVAALGLAMFALTRKLAARTEDTAQQQLISIFNTQSTTAWAIVDGVEVEVPLSQLQLGDTVVLHAGQKIPVDGLIVAGTAAIDQHTLTGEAQLVEKSCGDRVLASTIVISGKLHVQVEKAGHETLAAQIGDILNKTLDFKQQIVTTSQHIADRSTLPTLALSAFALPISGLSSALSLLYTATGYNLRLTGPISMLNFLQVASQATILIKDGRSLQLLAEVDTVVFDKTGTLTVDELGIKAIHCFTELGETEILRYAATAEHRQNHPIAKAIQNAAAAHGLAVAAVGNLHYEVGYGVRAEIDGAVVQVGSDRFMALEGLALSQEIQGLQVASQSVGHSLVMVAVNGVIVSAIELQPTIRPEAKAIIADLKQRNLTLYIISGDQEEPTRTLAQQLGIDHYFANTLPKDKATLVEQLQQEGKAVCFIGDGINDAIALKKANVSISLRGATTVATDVAQVVFMDGNLTRLPLLFALSQQFQRRMKTNIAMSVIPAVICGVSVFAFHTGLFAGILIYYAGTTVGLINSALPLFEKYDSGPR